MSHLPLIVEWEKALQWVFLSIFALTAILTVLSIPDWIKIPEWYKKKLFAALILEVIGAILLSYPTIAELNKKSDEVVVDNKYATIQKTTALSYKIKENWGLEVFHDSLELGFIPQYQLKSRGIFNAMKPLDGFNSGYQTVRWKESNGEWVQEKGLDGCDLSVCVFDSLGVVKYRICYGQDVLYTSSSSVVFNDGERPTHVFYKGGSYYIVRMSAARLNNADVKKSSKTLEKDTLQSRPQNVAKLKEHFALFFVIKLDPDFREV
ncbi:hypothetical protein LJC12_04370 [Odoribacter sp. OttesenSCG-928-J03]|nr:hypothetical protein [Odoribacter sp. OttesenSCG-928-J03]MDL2283141.1 hypothetical protein [Odoribacter sp. OttesenSCG-928-G04]MDL2330497.1 hypothetical protein [Odoribacter sp. OttesenSCG-928-A06]